MESLNPQIQLENVGPEVHSYIYQSIQELQPFVTENSSLTVNALDPLKLLSQVDEAEINNLPPRHRLKKMYRIVISITEDGTELQDEGLHENIFEAIRIAKDKLLRTLTEIQDDIISSQDRAIQITDALSANKLVH